MARAATILAVAFTMSAAVALMALLAPGRSTPATGRGAPSERDHPPGRRVSCAGQSIARFPGAYVDERNLVAGPLVLVGGGTITDAPTAREFGGNKFPLLLRAGHTATISVLSDQHSTAGLAYGPQPDGARDRRRTLTFTACSARRSGSRADGPVTFWSGFLLTSVPRCVALDVWIDREPRVRLAVALGATCRRSTNDRAPVRDCASRAESGKPDEGHKRPGEVVVGPLRFTGLKRIANRRELDLDRTGGRYGVKAGVLLPAGTLATLSIGEQARDWAALDYAPHLPGVPRGGDGDPAVRLRACDSDQPAFSYDGPVGPVTGFSGGFVLTRPGCVPLEVRVPGRRVTRARGLIALVPPGGEKRARRRPLSPAAAPAARRARRRRPRGA